MCIRDRRRAARREWSLSEAPAAEYLVWRREADRPARRTRSPTWTQPGGRTGGSGQLPILRRWVRHRHLIGGATPSQDPIAMLALARRADVPATAPRSRSCMTGGGRSPGRIAGCRAGRLGVTAWGVALLALVDRGRIAALATGLLLGASGLLVLRARRCRWSTGRRGTELAA